MTNLLLILLVFTLDILATRKIYRYPLMEKKSKRFHYFLIWLLPFIWSCLILAFPFDPPKKDKNFEKHRYMPTGYPMPTGSR